MIICSLLACQSAVTWLCFTPNSEQIITASKDGSMRIWNINGEQILKDDYFFTYNWFYFSSKLLVSTAVANTFKDSGKDRCPCLMLLVKNSNSTLMRFYS